MRLLSRTLWRVPTILRFRGFRIMIYTEDHTPIHVHAVKGKEVVIFELDCEKRVVRVRGRTRVRAVTVRRLKKFVGDNLTLLCEAWKELHGD